MPALQMAGREHRDAFAQLSQKPANGRPAQVGNLSELGGAVLVMPVIGRAPEDSAAAARAHAAVALKFDRNQSVISKGAVVSASPVERGAVRR